MVTSVPPAIVSKIERLTSGTFLGFSAASGGCINNGGRITTSTGEYFLKWNDASDFPGMLATEAKGLVLLQEAAGLALPDVIHTGTAGPFQYLLLEFIRQAPSGSQYWREFGLGLAALHQNTSAYFGLDHNNYIGSLVQTNTHMHSWTEFFVSRRLSPQLRMACDAGRLDGATTKKFDLLFNRLPSLLPEEPPALLHGDLWSGNLMITGDGKPCLIDPAVYYGNREVDLAMTQLFGGFDSSYFESYNEVYPLQPGYRDRLDLYNLYPLLVHVNLFGGAYASQVNSIIRRFVPV